MAADGTFVHHHHHHLKVYTDPIQQRTWVHYIMHYVSYLETHNDVHCNVTLM